MSEVARYDPEIDYGERGERCDAVMEEYSFGKFVRHSDYQLLIDRLESLDLNVNGLMGENLKLKKHLAEANNQRCRHVYEAVPIEPLATGACYARCHKCGYIPNKHLL